MARNTGSTTMAEATPLAERLRDRLLLGKAQLSRAFRNLGLPIRPRARLVFHPDYLDFPQESGPRQAFDVRRPQRILHRLQRLGLLDRRQVIRPRHATREEILTAHTAAFFDEIGEPSRLADLLHLPREELLFLVDPLGPFLSQCGGTIAAARHSLEEGLPVFNLGGGFHHAQRDRAEGFCPINDVAVAINVLRDERKIRQALVVDLDFHHGNGTALIFSRDEAVFTLSVHGAAWAEIEGKRNNIDVALPPGTTDKTYLEAVNQTLDQALREFEPDLVIYLAGADPFAEDRFGDFRVSEEALLRRDLGVLETLNRRRLPTAIVLAGGYGPMAWTIPFNFIFSVLAHVPIAAQHRPSNIAASFARIQQHLPPEQLATERSEISTDQILAGLDAGTAGNVGGRFLNFYTCEGIQLGLERYGILNLLREKGFEELLFSMDTENAARHLFRIHFDRRDADHLLVEIAACLKRLSLPGGERCPMVSVEWLCMQNPRLPFSLERPPLPNQRYPGLGLGRWVVELLRLIALRLECDGLMNNPDHYHNAFLYDKLMHFFDPRDQGRFLALRRVLDPLPLLDGTLAVEQGRVIDAGGTTLRWQGTPQVLPITARMQAYFDSAAYRQAVADAASRFSFALRET